MSLQEVMLRWMLIGIKTTKKDYLTTVTIQMGSFNEF